MNETEFENLSIESIPESSTQPIASPKEVIVDPQLISDTMDVHLDGAQQLKNSENQHEVDTFQQKLKLIKELRLYVDMGAITQDMADEILAYQLSMGELNSLIDEKTGLLGEKGFNLVLNKTIAHAERSGEKFSVIYLDLKGFKLVNDQEGHERGDEVLQLVGQYLADAVRKEDIVSHLHGDEYALILQGAGQTDAHNKFDIDALSYNLPMYIRAQLLEQGKEPRNAIVSARAGFAEFEPGDTFMTLKHKADTDMNNARDNELHHER